MHAKTAIQRSTRGLGDWRSATKRALGDTVPLWRQEESMTARKICTNFLYYWLIAWCHNALAIIGGHEIDPSSNPTALALVALQMSEVQADDRTTYYKGSSFLVGPDLLLTAAHNVAYIPDPKNIEAIFSSTPCWGPNTCGERRIAVKKAVFHSSFRQIPGGTEVDIAMVKLSEYAPTTSKPIMLLESSPTGRRGNLSVWGFGTDRQEQDVPLTNFRLRAIFGRSLVAKYQLGTNQKFWLDQRDGGFCGGDSGGPAITDGESAAGIAIHVTYENGLGNCLTKGAFTDILFFREWIANAAMQLQEQ